jgi:hypothetical protein
MKVFIGWDSRECAAYQVAVRSMLFKSRIDLNIRALLQPELRAMGLYNRPQKKVDNQMIDVISDAPMSTEFSLTRFLVPELAKKGWALYCDCDFLFRRDISELFDLCDDKYAVMVCKNDYKPVDTSKMDGKSQSQYFRKNWSSLMLFNCDHPAMKALNYKAVNNLTGLDLHTFKWLPDDLIGSLPLEWNWLEGWSDSKVEPKAVHFTRGTPDMPGYENVAYNKEWLDTLYEINAYWQIK